MAPRQPLSFDPVAEAARNWREAGWDEAAPGMAFVTSVMRAQQVFLARVDAALSPHGLSFARFEVLMLLEFSRSGRLPLSRVGQRLQVHPASVTNAIDRLEQAGFVTRVPHPTDGRTTLAAITRSGRRLVRKAAAALNDEVFTNLGVPTADAEQAVAVLATLRRNAGDFDLADG
ncbi:MAG: MarR family transcriptional regulator [Ilumatobacteraceae bacterium]